MTTQQHPYRSSRVVSTDSVLLPAPVCGCGQDLDLARGLHCPRCGTALAGHAS